MAEEHDLFPPLKGMATDVSRATRGDRSQVGPSTAQIGSASLTASKRYCDALVVNPDPLWRRSQALRLILIPFIYLKRSFVSLWPSYEFGDFLPVAFQLTRGAIMVGNRATPILLIGKFNQAEGTFQIVPVGIS